MIVSIFFIMPEIIEINRIGMENRIKPLSKPFRLNLKYLLLKNTKRAKTMMLEIKKPKTIPNSLKPKKNRIITALNRRTGSVMVLESVKCTIFLLATRTDPKMIEKDIIGIRKAKNLNMTDIPAILKNDEIKSEKKKNIKKNKSDVEKTIFRAVLITISDFSFSLVPL